MTSNNSSDVLVVIITCGSTNEADMIARELVEERLAACAQQLGTVRSTFWWNGAVQTEEECQVTLKTTRRVLDDLVARIQELHSYDVPEILALPVEEGLDDYLKWVQRETKHTDL